MSKTYHPREGSLIIVQDTETFFINKREDGIEIKTNFMTADGYEEGIAMNFNTEEAKSLFNFLKESQFY